MKLKLSLLFLCLIALLWSCPSDDYRYVALGGSRYSSTTIPRQTYNADSFFWGTWISMADGTAYNMQEQKVSVGDKLYWYKSGTSGDTLVAADLGKFVKQSDSVIINNSIPYFRQGGANLEYKVKIVGFSDSRAGATAIPLKNTKVKTQSETYVSFSKEETTDASGDVTLVMPTVNDVQTITVEKKDGGSVVVPNVKIETNNSNIGTIAVVQEGDYSLKVYGNVTNKDDGYMYADKWYNMTLVIKNISDVKAAYSKLLIDKKFDKLNIRSTDSDINDKIFSTGYTIDSMQPNATYSIPLQVQILYEDIDSGYVDVGFGVSITNGVTEKTWDDYVPLRIFKGKYSFTIAAKGSGKNKSAELYGFIIYEDKNSMFFKVRDKSNVTIYAPSFNLDQDFIFVFSGATVGYTLSESTEMFYTVNEDETPLPVSQDFDKTKVGQFCDTEDNACEIFGDSFESYIGAEEIRYFKMKGSKALQYQQ